MNEELKRKVIAFYENVKINGSKRPADNEAITNFEKPSWFDLKKFEMGNKTGREYFFSIFTAHLSGLVILVYNQSIFETLISTGNSQNVISLFKRYFSTAKHVKKWYDGNIFDKQNFACKSIRQIRNIHKRVMDERNKNLIIDQDILKFSQLDMFMTQYAFMGQIIANGDQFGLKFNEEQLVGLIHFWRCVSYLLGIEDQFNLFTVEDLEFQKCLCRYVLEVEIKPIVSKSTSEDARIMSWGICASIKGIVSLIDANTFLKFSFITNGLEQEANKLELNFYEETLFRIMNFTFGYLYQFSFARNLLNRLLSLSFNRTEERFFLKTKRLSLTYPNVNIYNENKDFTAISL